MRYEGRAQPALKALDPGGQVIQHQHLLQDADASLRVGFLVADGPVYNSLLDSNGSVTWQTATLIQRALEAYVTVGRYQAYLRRACQIYRKRRDAMLAAIERHLPAGSSVEPPQGGLFCGCTCPTACRRMNCCPWRARRACLCTRQQFLPGRHRRPRLDAA